MRGLPIQKTDIWISAGTTITNLPPKVVFPTHVSTKMIRSNQEAVGKLIVTFKYYL
jgi:hypothetical protein